MGWVPPVWRAAGRRLSVHIRSDGPHREAESAEAKGRRCVGATSGGRVHMYGARIRPVLPPHRAARQKRARQPRPRRRLLHPLARPWDAATGARVRRPATPPVLVTPLSRDRRPGRPWRRVRASGRDPGPATRCRPPGLPPSDGDAVVAGLAAGAKRVIGQGHGDDRIGRMAVPEQIIDPAVLVLAIEGLKPRQLEFVALQGRDVAG